MLNYTKFDQHYYEDKKHTRNLPVLILFPPTDVCKSLNKKFTPKICF